ncbi:MAG: Farnesyl diphosphate synthase [Syntrophus sp. SKADARSKE-3]|nr:Farnesyl diphosphate synthase [Syntrophus sp. SKADARSKE-3]
MLQTYLRDRKELVDKALDRLIPAENNDPAEIFNAMRYSLFAGGKRLRPILCIAAAEAVGGSPDLVMPIACALECIHTYSLIHDDLPAMDDDDFRRGKPTNHKVFGEATAILAGDALLTEAFSILAGAARMDGMDASRLIQAMAEIARAAGVWGMVGGQVMDIRAEGKAVDTDFLYGIHERKTGAMIRVSVRSGALLAGGNEEQITALTDYGRRIGLAFQIADDLLNVTGDSALMGKNTGSDTSRGKATFPALLGMEASRSKLASLVQEATASLAHFDEKAAPLRRIAEYIMEREY